MRLRLLSDLHLEFYPDGGLDFIKSLPSVEADVLVLAGDIVSFARPHVAVEALRRLANLAPHTLYITGNHEYYNTSPLAVHVALEKLNIPNFTIMDLCPVTHFQGYKFVGGTLWFKDDPLAVCRRDEINDFHLIRDFIPWVFDENQRFVGIADREVDHNSVVITHHLPSMRSVPEQWRNSPLNSFFVCDLERLIHERQPPLWLHGHTHDSAYYKIGRTHVVCNPFGYPHEMNRVFDRTLTITVLSPSGNRQPTDPLSRDVRVQLSPETPNFV